MPRSPRLHSSDLRGAARLATDATAGLTDLVEAMHEHIARLPGFGAQTPAGRTRGITGLVYKTVRGVTRVVGGSVDGLLALLAPALAPSEHTATPSAEREAIVAALNGVLGDHLAASANPLATVMSLRTQGRTLELEPAALAARLPTAGPRMLVLIHGLCMNDLQWLREGHDHGAALARECGYTPVYLHYNSGLHVSTNGRLLALALERVLEAWPAPIERCVLLGHSMGGLLARSALEQGAAAGQRWPAHVTDLVCLGTPHHGAPLERAGHWVDILLGATPYAAPFARLGRLRSAGITDLRHGNLVDADWAEHDRFAHGADTRQPVPLPAGVRCHALAASLGEKAGDAKDRLIGDGLVPLDSALGRHNDTAHCLAFAEQRQWIGYRMNHLDLLNRPEVFAQLRQWLA
ncbi:MAG: alpha/beta hydrolase [Pseudomonadota bacterium]